MNYNLKRKISLAKKLHKKYNDVFSATALTDLMGFTPLDTRLRQLVRQYGIKTGIKWDKPVLTITPTPQSSNWLYKKYIHSMKILILTMLLTTLSTTAFAGVAGSSHHKTRTIEGRKCLYFYDHNNNLVSVSCSC